MSLSNGTQLYQALIRPTSTLRSSSKPFLEEKHLPTHESTWCRFSHLASPLQLPFLPLFLLLSGKYGLFKSYDECHGKKKLILLCIKRKRCTNLKEKDALTYNAFE
jgi:hypothetical protein